MDLKQKTVFITGTDTGVGKSIFTSFLALLFLNQGKKVAISKPIQTGNPDTRLLTELTNNKIPIFNTYSFSLAAAPVVSAKEESKEIDVKKIISGIRKLEKEFDHVIVEGIGGIAVPLVGTDQCVCPESYLIADLIKDLNYPAIIVSYPTLGTINHTVLTIEFAKQRELKVLGFVISGYDEVTNDTVLKTAPGIISNLTNLKCLMRVPFIDNICFKSLESLVNSLKPKKITV